MITPGTALMGSARISQVLCPNIQISKRFFSPHLLLIRIQGINWSVNCWMLPPLMTMCHSFHHETSSKQRTVLLKVFRHLWTNPQCSWMWGRAQWNIKASSEINYCNHTSPNRRYVTILDGHARRMGKETMKTTVTVENNTQECLQHKSIQHPCKPPVTHVTL